MRYLKLSSELRENFEYNNFNYIVAAEIVAQLSGTPFTEFVQRNFLEPLAMDQSTYSTEIAERSGLKVRGMQHHGWDGYEAKTAFEQGSFGAKDAGEFKEMTFWTEWDYFAGPGGLWTSLEDMV